MTNTYDYDRRTGVGEGRVAAKKVPLSQRSPAEQAAYWAGSAYSALRAGMPDGARESLAKTEAILERDPELKRIPGLQAKLRGAFQALGSYDPRSANHLVESVVSLLKARGDRRASGRSYVVKWQYRGGKSQEQPLPTEDRAESYAKLMLSAAGKQPIYLAVETQQNGVVIDTKLLKGTVSPAQKKLVKLRADLARLQKLQEHAVGPLNKAEFEEDIEWTEREIARLSR